MSLINSLFPFKRIRLDIFRFKRRFYALTLAVKSLIYRHLERLIPATERGHGAHRLRCRFPEIPGAFAMREMLWGFWLPISFALSLSLMRVHALCDALYPSCSVAVTTRAFHTPASQHPCIPVWYRSAGHSANRPRRITACWRPQCCQKNKAEFYIIWYVWFLSPSSRTRSSSALHQNDVRAY